VIQRDTLSPPYVDPRGLRFTAWVTTAVLAAVLVTASGWLLLAQAAVFALGASSLQRHPYGALYKRLVQPRLGPPAELEDPRPPRFAQAVGLGFAALGALALLAGATTLGLVLTAAALAAAFLNAAFGFCLGCEAYLLIKRTTTRGVPA
jgi:hypothetical protein